MNSFCVQKSVISFTNLLFSFHFAITSCLKITASIHPMLFLHHLELFFNILSLLGFRLLDNNSLLLNFNNFLIFNYFLVCNYFFIFTYFHFIFAADGQVGPRQEELIQRVNYGRDSANSVNSLSSSASSNRLTIITNIKRSLQCKIVNNSEEFLDFWDQHR